MRRWDWVGRIIDSELPATTRLVAHTLASFADKNGHCWPSYATIAKAAGTNRATVVRHIAVLSDHGWLDVVNRVNKHGKQSNSYLLKNPVDNPLPSRTEQLGVVAQNDHLVAQSDHLGSRTERHRTNSQRTTPDEPGSNAPTGHLAAVIGAIGQGMRV